MAKVDSWVEHTIIGYTPLGEDGLPHQPTLGKDWRRKKKPITVYKDLKRAVKYSPINSAAEVRMFTLELLNG